LGIVDWRLGFVPILQSTITNPQSPFYLKKKN